MKRVHFTVKNLFLRFTGVQNVTLFIIRYTFIFVIFKLNQGMEVTKPEMIKEKMCWF